MTTAELAAAVARGAVLLDVQVPGWWDRVDLDALIMSHCFNCVLGQLFGGYHRGLCEIDKSFNHGLRDWPAIEHGFDVMAGNRDTTAALNALWREAILARRAASRSGQSEAVQT